MFSVPITPFPVEKEYEKNPDIKPEDIAKLRQWFQTQPHLPHQHVSDLDLIVVYHCCEKSAEVSKQLLDLHYTVRTLFTVFFKDRYYDETVKSVLTNALIAPLESRTLNNYRAIYCRLLTFDPRHFLFPEAVRVFMLIYDLWQQLEGTWPGFVLIIDMDQSRFGHITKLEPMVVKQMLYYLQEAMYVKLKEVHFINAPSFVDKLMMILKPFLKKELLDMIHIHEVGSETLYKFLPKSILPKESGGDYKEYNTIRDEIMQWLEANKELIAKENLRRVNEALRPGGKPPPVASMFGVEGSFKKLDID